MIEKFVVNKYVNKIHDFKGILVYDTDLKKIKKPLVLDIGCGNGESLVYDAENNKNKQFLGVELQYKEIYRTAKKIADKKLTNCNVIRLNAKLITDFFLKDEIEQVNIFFPDPWSKRKQKKHRLIQLDYLYKMLSIMKNGSRLNIKTDNNDYFMHIFDVIKILQSQKLLKIIEFSRDIHSTKYSKQYRITSFERIFLSQKLLINYLSCVLTKP